MRACSAETAAARCWSFQKPGAESWPSSSLSRAESESGSKVITDPAELGPDLLELLIQWRGGFHAYLDGTFGRVGGHRAAAARFRVARVADAADVDDRLPAYARATGRRVHRGAARALCCDRARGGGAPRGPRGRPP